MIWWAVTFNALSIACCVVSVTAFWRHRTSRGIQMMILALLFGLTADHARNQHSSCTPRPAPAPGSHYVVPDVVRF